MPFPDSRITRRSPARTFVEGLILIRQAFDELDCGRDGPPVKLVVTEDKAFRLILRDVENMFHPRTVTGPLEPSPYIFEVFGIEIVPDPKGNQRD